MKIGLYDVDSHNFPNLALMKISAYHKAQGDEVEWINFFFHYDIVYVSKVFGDEYSRMDLTCISADKIIYGGTGFAIEIVNGKEVYHKDKDKPLPYEIEHIYPDYSLYPKLTKNKAYGFLSRGCPNNCAFCLVSDKEGKCSFKVADLSEWWDGQKEIVLLDPNILAMDVVKPNPRNAIVYILTNFDTDFEQDYYRVKMVQDVGMTPDIRIYRKNTAPKLTRDLQRWCNNRRVYRCTPDFMDYVPRADGKTIKQLYFDKE